MVFAMGCLLYWKPGDPTITVSGRYFCATSENKLARFTRGNEAMTMSESKDKKSEFRQAMQGVRRIKNSRIEFNEPKPKATAKFTRRDEQKVLEQSLDGPPYPGEIQTGEEMVYASPTLSRQVLRKLRRGQYSFGSHCDLHGLTAEQARLLLEEFIDESLRRRTRCVLVVHGKGRGSGPGGPVIKPMVGSYLRQRAEVAAYCSALPADGGSGAVYVLLVAR